MGLIAGGGAGAVRGVDAGRDRPQETLNPEAFPGFGSCPETCQS